MVQMKQNNEFEGLWLEKISLEGIASVTKVSKKWLQDYVNKKYAERVKRYEEARELDIKKPFQSLIVEADELWSFVRKKQVN